MSETRTDYYGYNMRGELISTAKNAESAECQYTYDGIGNRLTSIEPDAGGRGFVPAACTANNLNQYTQISDSVASALSAGETFQPRYDLDGNQTLVKTSTGVWQVAYNGENRPVSWTSGTTNIVMEFDRMRRCAEYVEMKYAFCYGFEKSIT